MSTIISVKGTIRKKVTKGVWPIRKEIWESSRFTCELSPENPKASFDGILSLRLEQKEGTLVLMAKVKSVTCMFGQIDLSDPQPFHFQMTSVARLEVTGNVSVRVEEESPRSV